MMKKTKIAIIASIVGSIVIAGATVGTIAIVKNKQEENYQLALSKLVNRDFASAYTIFDGLNNYKDSVKKKDYAYQLKSIVEGKKDYERMIDEIVTFKGVVTVSFSSLGGTTFPDRTIKDISKEKYIYEVPEKRYTDFATWNVTYGRYDKSSDSIYMALTASYTDHEYKIEYDLGGGSTYLDLPSTYTYYSKEITIPRVNKPGYYFLGYYDNSNEDHTPILDYVIPAHSYGDLYLTAVYEAQKYTVYFDPVDGTCDTTEGEYIFAEDYSATFPVAVKDYYTFAGWYFYDQLITPESFNLTRNHSTLTAHYLPEEYSITYEIDEGVTMLGVGPTSYNYESPDLYFPFAHKDDHCFVGWKIKDSADNADIHFCLHHHSHGDIVMVPVFSSIEYKDEEKTSIFKLQYDITHPANGIVFPSNITYIPEQIFMNYLANIWDFYFESNEIYHVENHAIIHYDENGLKELIAYPRGRARGSETIDLPEVDAIGMGGLSYVEVPHVRVTSRLKVIKKDAFYNSTILDLLNADIERVEEMGFYSAESLNGYFLKTQQNLSYIGDKGFYCCYDLHYAYFGPNLTHVGSMAFGSIRHLAVVEFAQPKDLEIPGDVFDSDTEIREVTSSIESLYDNLAYIPTYHSLTENTIEKINVYGKGQLPSEIFKGFTTLKEINFLDVNFTEISESSFENTTNLEVVYIPKTVTKIAAHAFENSGVKRIVFEDVSKLLLIEKDAFKNSGLESIDLSLAKNLTIEDGAFTRSDSLTDVILHYDSVTSFVSAFEGCGNIKHVSIYYQKNKLNNCTLAEGYLSGQESVEYVDFIYGDKAESEDKKLLELSNSCFKGCTNLKDIELYNFVIDSIGMYAFENCSSFTNEHGYFSNLETYPAGAFFGCSSLTNITFVGTTKIEKYAFVGCVSLETVKIYDTVTEIGREAFAYVSPSTLIEVELSSAEANLRNQPDGPWYLWDMNCMGVILYNDIGD